MEYRYVGRSGLRVTPVCMGTMSFGTWSDKAESFRILDKSFDRGINFFDTAEAYPVPPTAELAGLTEEIFGEWLQAKPRDAVIVATKVAGAAGGWFVPPIRHGLTAVDRHHIERAFEGSLRRMGIDYIDLYQVHWPDPIVPMEETMAALDRLVESGKVRYLGTSNETSYGLTKSNMIAEYEGLARFESIQNNFSLLHRRFLDELAQVCRNEKVSLLPYSPMAAVSSAASTTTANRRRIRVSATMQPQTRGSRRWQGASSTKAPWRRPPAMSRSPGKRGCRR